MVRGEDELLHAGQLELVPRGDDVSDDASEDADPEVGLASLLARQQAAVANM